MKRGWKMLFVTIYLILSTIQLSLFYSIYRFEFARIQSNIIRTLGLVKSEVESHEINRHKTLFDAYKNKYLCGEDYLQKSLTLSFVIAPDEPFHNLKDLTDIITRKLYRQAVSSATYLLEQLPVDTVYRDSVLKASLSNLDKRLSYRYLEDEIPLVKNEDRFSLTLFDDYRLYQPQTLTLSVSGIRQMLLGKIVLLVIGSVLSMLLILVATRYTYLNMIRYRRLADDKTEFIHHLAHEIKTPLSSIYLSGQALLDERITRERETLNLHARIIFNEAERLNTQLGQVLSISAANKNFLSLKLEPVSIHEQIRLISSLFQARLNDLKGTLEMQLNALQNDCMIDKIHFGNVLYNLIDNAIKFSNPDKVQICIETCNEASDLKIRISDRGKGIHPNELKTIFNLFYQHDQHIHGFGVGLHYAKTIFDRLHGKIDVESIPGSGTTFILHLPQIT